ncbi:MAG: hypothetical protein QXI19_05050 [Candidatus Caldarchaeum sp.]
MKVETHAEAFRDICRMQRRYVAHLITANTRAFDAYYNFVQSLIEANRSILTAGLGTEAAHAAQEEREWADRVSYLKALEAF